jgi:hypothetical protein
MFLYLIVNHVNNKIYIGKTKTGDLQKYLKSKFWDAAHQRVGNSYLFNAIRKYGPEYFHIYPLVSTLTTNEDLCFWERVLIAQYDAQNPDVGYNICRGGEGHNGPHSEATCLKIAENSRRMWQRPGHKEAFSLKMMGHDTSPETVKKITAARALQDESARLAGWKTNKGNAGNLSHEAHVLGGKAGSREAKQRAARISVERGSVTKAQHTRWHINRGQVNLECSLCQLSSA